MILQLDDNYRILSDERNFILQRKADPEKNPRKNRKVKEATDQWKNLGCWKDLSQLLSSCTRPALRSEIGKTSFKVLNIAVFDGHLDPIVKCDANARAGHKTRNHVASAVQGDVISPYDDVALVLHHQFGVFHDCYSAGGGGLP